MTRPISCVAHRGRCGPPPPGRGRRAAPPGSRKPTACRTADRVDRAAVFVGGAQQFGVAVAADAADREGRGDHQGDADEASPAPAGTTSVAPTPESPPCYATAQPLSWKSNWGSAQAGPYATAHAQRTAHPRRPARGRRRPREPSLPRLRRAALRLALAPARPGAARSAAARAAASASSARPASPRRRCASWTGSAARAGRGSPTAPATPPRSAAPAGPGWSRAPRYLFTVEAVRRLVARRDQVVKSSRWAPAAGLAATWQTLLNSVTFGHNVALAALGRGAAAHGEAPLAAADRRPGQHRAGDPGAARSRSRSSWPAASSAAAPSSRSLRTALGRQAVQGRGSERAPHASDRGRRNAPLS